MRRSWFLALLACLVLNACATREPIRGGDVRGEFDRKLSTYAYIEEGNILTLIVGTRAARDKDGQGYMPLEVAIVNHGLRKLSLTRESFTLIDAEGKRYPVASPRELLRGYELLDFDRNLAELGDILDTRFGAFARYPSNFSPTRTGRPGRSSLVRDLVVLPKHGYLIDFLFFPAPLTGIRDHSFELFLDSPDLEDPIFVRFEVL